MISALYWFDYFIQRIVGLYNQLQSVPVPHHFVSTTPEIELRTSRGANLWLLLAPRDVAWLSNAGLEQCGTYC